jgi:hypothetical protein
MKLVGGCTDVLQLLLIIGDENNSRMLSDGRHAGRTFIVLICLVEEGLLAQEARVCAIWRLIGSTEAGWR